MPPSHRDPSGQRRSILAILGMAAIIGGGVIAATTLSHRTAAVKPATGTAQAMALAGDKPATH